MIRLNGVKTKVEQETLSYEEIVELAGLRAGRVYTVVYTKGVNGSKGSLTASQSVKVIDGMNINADDTSNA